MKRRLFRGGLAATFTAAAIFLFLFVSRGGGGPVEGVQDAEAYPWIKFGVAGSPSAEPYDNEICNEILTSPTFDTGNRCWAGYTWRSPKMGEDLYALNMIHPCSTYHVPDNEGDEGTKARCTTESALMLAIPREGTISMMDALSGL